MLALWGSLASIIFFLGLQLLGHLLQLGLLLLRREEERRTDPQKPGAAPGNDAGSGGPGGGGEQRGGRLGEPGAAGAGGGDQGAGACEPDVSGPDGGTDGPPLPPRSASPQELKRLEEQLRAAGANLTPKNWPFCCPVLYHNIAEEVPEDMQVCVTRCYYTYLGLIVCFFWNTISVMGAGFALNKRSGTICTSGTAC